MNPPERPDVNTGGGGYLSGGVQAAGDAQLGAVTIGRDQHIHHYGSPVPATPFVAYQHTYTPDAPPPPGTLPDPGPLPPGSRLPYSRNPLFTGREDDLNQLAALLLVTSEERSSLDTRHSTLVTLSTGIGGVGKTQLAVEFAHRYGHFFHGVHWISMSDPAAAESEIIACGLEMGLYPPGGAVDRPTKLAAVRRAWAAGEPRLLIFDNCDDPELLTPWRPMSGGARLLVTSRNTVWPAEWGAAVLPVAPLPRAESLALLRAYLVPTGREETDEALGGVAAAVGELPLALALAGHYLARYRRESIADYLRALREAAELLPVGRGAFSPTGHDLSVWNTFAVSYDKLRDDDEVDAAAVALLARAACFAPGEPLPEGLLLATMGDAGRAADDGLSRLLELGLLERVGASAYRLHILMGRFVEEEAARKEREGAKDAEGEEEASRKNAEGAKEESGVMAAARAAVEEAVFSRANEQNQAGYPQALREWEIHLRYVVDRAAGRDDETAAKLCGELDYYLGMSGDLRGALPYSRKALDIRERVLGLEHPDTATSLNNLGALLDSMGDLPAARPYYERTLDIRERVLGPDHPDTALSLNNMGFLLRAIGDLPAARPYFERALAISEGALGPDHPNTALTLNNMGSLLQGLSDLPTARLYYERALDINERVLGPNHPDTAGSLNNLGYLLRAMGDLPAAWPYFERALDIYERILGPEHPDTATSLNNLGGLLQDLGDLPAAQPYFERALDIRERVLGPDHPDTAVSLNNLGSLLQVMGDLATARPYFERAIAIEEKALGPDHPDVAKSLTNLAVLYVRGGDFISAERLLARAHRINHKALGSRHPVTTSVQMMLAQVQQVRRLPPEQQKKARFALGRVTEGGTFFDSSKPAQKKPPRNKSPRNKSHQPRKKPKRR